MKYGAIGVMATAVQYAVFYLLAATCCRCLGAGDWAVRYCGLPAAELADSARAARFALDTALGFTAANVFCWLMNRAFVFRSGRYRWWVEFGFFFGTAAVATAVATGLCFALINWCGLMTTIAVFIEVVVSFLFNFFVRKFLIFQG